jgi:hypothetical protein
MLPTYWRKLLGGSRLRYWLCPTLIERPFVEQASKPLLRLLYSQHSNHQVLGATPKWIVLGLLGRSLQAANFVERRHYEVQSAP